MRVGIPWGQSHLELEVAEANLISARRPPTVPAIADVPEAVRHALEAPLDYPPLRRALTPDDHVAVIVDESVPRLAAVLTPLLDHIVSAGVAPEAISLVCHAASTGQKWTDDLPDAFQEVQVEVHQPGDRKKLAYLATTRQGRRVYLNRTIVDADQTVVLTRRGYDPLTGIGGAETAIYPALSDEATLQETARPEAARSSSGDSPFREEAVEIAWLLGAPFLVQVIEGAGDDIIHVLAGPVQSSGAGQKLLADRWRLEVDRRADVVIASITGDPDQAIFENLAHAFLSASRVVKPGGKIVVLADALPPLGRASDILRQNEEPSAALRVLLDEKPSDLGAGFAWASAAQQAKLYLLSRLPEETVEEMFATPLQKPEQAQRVLGPRDTCLMLPDAHKTWAVVPKR